MRTTRRTLFKLAAAAPAAEVAAEKKPAAPDRFVAHFPPLWNASGFGSSSSMIAINRADIHHVKDSDWSEAHRLHSHTAFRGNYFAEPILIVEATGFAQPIILAGHQAKRFLEWWRG